MAALQQTDINKCKFGQFCNSPCNIDSSYFIYECTRDTSNHISHLKCSEQIPEKTLKFFEIPEALLILYRSGAFSFDTHSFQQVICTSHRDFLGTHWRLSKTKCCYPGHSENSKAKADRGATPSMCKAYWLKTRQTIPIGSGICKFCATKLKNEVYDMKVNFQDEIATFHRVQHNVFDLKDKGTTCLQAEENRIKDVTCMEFEENVFIATQSTDAHGSHNVPVDLDSQISIFTESTNFSQCSASDWETENLSSKERFNRALNILGNGDYPLLKNQLNLAWEDVSKSTRAHYTKLSSDIIDLVLSYIVPGQVNKVFSSIAEKRKTADAQSMMKQDVMTEALIKAYLEQNCRQTQLQILSLFVHQFTKQKLMTLIPGITMTRIDAARKHANLEKPGQMINSPKIYRMRLSQSKLMHFIEFISSPMYHQAVGYGSKTLHLSSGLEMNIPKVVRNIITSRLIKCYTTYCKDQNYETFSRSTLFNVLNCCVAAQKKNMHGLDNITADGMKAVDDVSEVIARLQTFRLEEDKVEKLRQMILSANQHLKFEMKGHMSSESTCIDHCTVHSLSDASSINFRAKCNHEHTDGCNNCSLVDKFFNELENTFRSQSSLPADIVDELDHDISKAKYQILAWKAHCVRTVHQDRAKTEVLSKLKDNQAFVVMDWAMKLLPIKHREAQSDFFGKKGISWHISSLILSSDSNDLNVYTFVHILELGNQGWFSVAHIITDLLHQIRFIKPAVSELIMKSDNAGCYHCVPLISFIQSLNINGDLDIKISQYNFSEAQSGKDICDAKTAHCKMHIFRYTSEGHDVLTPEDMITALNSNGGVKGVFASVIAVDQKYEVKTKAKIPNISFLNNFEFHANGVIARRAYGLGSGLSCQLNDKTFNIPLEGFKVVVPFPTIEAEYHGRISVAVVAPLQENVLGDSNNNIEDTIQENDVENEEPTVVDDLFACPDQSCVKVYTHSRFLEAHIIKGNHVYSSNESSYDKVKLIWADKCTAVDRQYKVLVQSVCSLNSETAEGWALKTARPCRRFTKRVKDYLYNIYLNCNLTGKRPNFDRLSSELKLQRTENGTKMFSRDEWLSQSQIRSLFANFVKLGTQVVVKSEEDEEIQNVLQEIEALEYHSEITHIVTDITSQFE